VSIDCRALLFDLDGVLVDSIPATERQWRRWAGRHGIDWPALRHGMAGVPTRQVIEQFAPHLDAVAEAVRLEEDQVGDTDGVTAMPGAADLLSSLPAAAWAVVTSGTRALAITRLEVAGLSRPLVLVTSDDVTRGKPDPEPYLLAAARLGVEPADAVVVEDAAAGVAAGKAGGFRVISVGPGPRPGADLHAAGVGVIRAEAHGDLLRLRLSRP